MKKMDKLRMCKRFLSWWYTLLNYKNENFCVCSWNTLWRISNTILYFCCFVLLLFFYCYCYFSVTAFTWIYWVFSFYVIWFLVSTCYILEYMFITFKSQHLKYIYIYKTSYFIIEKTLRSRRFRLGIRRCSFGLAVNHQEHAIYILWVSNLYL